MSEVPTEAPQSKKSHSRHRHHSHGKPMTLRTRVMRHVAGFVVLFVFFLLSIMIQSGRGGTSSDWSVLFYVISVVIAYGVGFYGYPIVHRAWLDSKK